MNSSKILHENMLKSHKRITIGLLIVAILGNAVAIVRCITNTSAGDIAAKDIIFEIIVISILFALMILTTKYYSQKDISKYIMVTLTALVLFSFNYFLGDSRELFASFYLIMILSLFYFDTKLTIYASISTVFLDFVIRILGISAEVSSNDYVVRLSNFTWNSIACVFVALVSSELLKYSIDKEGQSQKLLDNLKQVLTNVKTSSESVFNLSHKLAKSTEESSASMEQVASSISNISRDMMDNLSFIQEGTTNVGEVSNSAAMVARSCQEVADQSKKVRQDAVLGGESVKQVLLSVNDVAKSSVEVQKVIDELSSLSHKIGEIIEIITGISTQTNLLSLNAAIEAARAGDAGKGFAVVADEIRKLASESNDAAKDIINLVKEVQDKTQNAVEKMNVGSTKVQDGVRKATDTDNYIQGIVSAIDSVATQIAMISQVAAQQSELTKRMNESMENILKITQTTSDSSQQISAGVQEQTVTFQEIGYVASQLSQMAEELNNIANQFRVE